MQTTYSILTAYGRNKEAECIANGTPLVLTEIAFGDGDRIPAGGETSLQNELVRKPIATRGVVEGTPNASYFDALLEAADGPYVIREGGLFDDTGGMVAIVKYDPVVNKPIAESGQSAEAQMRMVVAFTDLQNLVLQINAIGSYVPAERRIDTADGTEGGGPLDGDRTIKLAVHTLDEITGDQVSEAEGNIDWIPLRDSSAGKHKKLRPSEFARAIGVQSKINTSLANHLADIDETKAGEIDSKSVHPEGLHATLAEKLGGGFNVRSFEHANDSDAPTALEWAAPVNGDKALVSNADDDSWALYQRRADAWVVLSSGGGGSGWRVLADVDTNNVSYADIELPGPFELIKWRFEAQVTGNVNSETGDRLRAQLKEQQSQLDTSVTNTNQYPIIMGSGTSSSAQNTSWPNPARQLSSGYFHLRGHNDVLYNHDYNSGGFSVQGAGNRDTPATTWGMYQKVPIPAQGESRWMRIMPANYNQISFLKIKVWGM